MARAFRLRFERDHRLVFACRPSFAWPYRHFDDGSGSKKLTE